VARAFKKRNITVETGITITGVDTSGPALTVRATRGDESGDLEVDAVVVSVGRRARSEGIGLEGSGVGVDARGFVEVDDHLRTAVPGVYAVGDLVATPALAHVGFAEAIVAIRTILGEDVPAVDYDRVPWGIYCHPEVAFTGLTEQAAQDRGHDVVTSIHRFGGNGRALIIGESDGMVKIVAERDGPILGVHIAGPWATELIAEGYLAVNWEATAEDLAALIHPHPTLSEAFGMAAMAFTGRSYD
jgi:dihydrolipoamide dehydrogenase